MVLPRSRNKIITNMFRQLPKLIAKDNEQILEEKALQYRKETCMFASIEVWVTLQPGSNRELFIHDRIVGL